MWYDERQQRRRWLAYFDLLGTRALIGQGRMTEVFDAYSRAIECVSDGLTEEAPLHRLWFSDAFIVLADDDGGKCCWWVDHLARCFMFDLILNEIPVRGAISCGQIYESRTESILFGPGLVEAYDYGEDQDWIGLVLSPSAEARMADLGVPAGERLNYARYSGTRHRKLQEGNQLYACMLGNWFLGYGGHNFLLEKLERMKSRAQDPRVIAKYERTCEFIRENQRWVPDGDTIWD